MPRYDFRCKKCSTEKSALLGIDDRNSAPECDECNEAMKRIYNGHAVIKIPHPLSRDASAAGSRGGSTVY